MHEDTYTLLYSIRDEIGTETFTALVTAYKEEINKAYSAGWRNASNGFKADPVVPNPEINPGPVAAYREHAQRIQKLEDDIARVKDVVIYVSENIPSENMWTNALPRYVRDKLFGASL
jgi:hypothetical protein